jgi:hypothetical protein
VTHLQLWATWLFVYVGTPLAWASFLLHLCTPWQRTEVGRHLLAYAFVIAAILTFTTVRWLWFRTHSFPTWLQFVQFGTYLALITVMGWRVVLQVREAWRPGTPYTPAESERETP